MKKQGITMPEERYVAALERQRKRIAEGLSLKFEDSTTLGDKHTECSWGLCSKEKAAWPDAQDHLWPDQFEKYERVAPKYLQRDQRCPLDRREPGEETMRGCYYTCRIFNPEGPLPTREQAIVLYDNRIKQRKTS